MIDSIKDQLLSTLDPNIVYMCVAVLAVLVILALVKKAFKIAAVIVVIAILFGFIAPMATEYQKNFSITSEDGVLTLTVNGEQYVLNTKEVKDKYGEVDNSDKILNVEMQRLASGEYTLTIKYADGNIGKFDVPGFMRSPIISFLDKYNVKHKLIE
ncbi:MAG: hypothetical protein IJ593_02220 [Lachnospiraceae bacterium]|nr:hypothetical protein [Lachnospiraceae bacterium]